MASSAATTTTTEGGARMAEYNAIVIGAGVAWLYLLYRLREMGASTTCGTVGRCRLRQ